ncbi:MAG: hypothetical protein WDN00_04575 [Limisphaerales bacterium]
MSHAGGDYHFAVNMTNVNLHEWMADLSSPSNSLEGTLAGQLVITNASTEDLQSWRGFCQVSLQNGLLWSVPGHQHCVAGLEHGFAGGWATAAPRKPGGNS